MFKIMHLAGTAWHQGACSDLCVSFDRPLHHNILKGLFWIVLQECFSSAEYVIWLNASAPGGSKPSKLESNFSQAKSYDKKPKGGYYSNSNRFAAYLEPCMVNLYCIHSLTKNAFFICDLLALYFAVAIKSVYNANDATLQRDIPCVLCLYLVICIWYYVFLYFVRLSGVCGWRANQYVSESSLPPCSSKLANLDSNSNAPVTGCNHCKHQLFAFSLFFIFQNTTSPWKNKLFEFLRWWTNAK